MAGVSQFTCVRLYGFHSSFLIVFFPYTEDYTRSQHLVVSPTVCSTHCGCATNVHLIPASGDDEVNNMTVSRAGMRPGRLASFCLNMVLVTIRSNSVNSANKSSSLELHFPIPYLVSKCQSVVTRRWVIHTVLLGFKPAPGSCTV